MTTKISIKLQDKQWFLYGDLLFESVNTFWQEKDLWLEQISQEKLTQVQVNLSKTGRVDSSGLALLILMIKEALKNNCHLILKDIPCEVLDLISLSQAEVALAEHLELA